MKPAKKQTNESMRIILQAELNAENQAQLKPNATLLRSVLRTFAAAQLNDHH